MARGCKLLAIGFLALSSTYLSSCGNQNALAHAPIVKVNNQFIDHRPASCPSDKNSEAFTKLLGKTIKGPIIPLPSNIDVDGNSWKLTSNRASNAQLYLNPQELCGVKGMSVDRAWSYSLGSPNTVIAVIDSGINWCDPSIVDKVAINTKALPLPENSQGFTKTQLEKIGKKFKDNNPYDLNNSGIINVSQYEGDPRVKTVATFYGGYFCANQTDEAYHGISLL